MTFISDKTLLQAGVVFICVFTVIFYDMQASAEPNRFDGQKLSCKIFNQVNAFRAENNKACLQRNKFLDKAAQSYAVWFTKHLTKQSEIKFNHTADGRNPGARAKAAGYKPKPKSVQETIEKRELENGKVVTRIIRKIKNNTRVGENILYFEGSRLCQPNTFIANSVEGWKNSRVHRRNMLSDGWNATGVGVAMNPKTKRCFGIQMFGVASMKDLNTACRAQC